MKHCNIFFLLLLLLAAVPLRAQSPSGHFEWARTYTGIQVNPAYGYNEIVGSAVDSLGNLYIAGHFTYEGILDANAYTDLYPDSLFATRYINIVIAKFSPSGEMLWHKLIIDQSPSRVENCYLRDMKMVGDSSIMVAVDFPVPIHGPNVIPRTVYYLDTLIQDQNYFHSMDSIWPMRNNAFITFDFDGNVTEQHFVSIGLLDAFGNPMGSPGFTYIYGQHAFAHKFAVDHKGNIYVLHGMSNDHQGEHSIFNGGVSAQVIYVDGVRHQTNPVGPTAVWSEYQIMKFSPHFDSLLGCTYIIDTSTSTDYFGLIESIKYTSFNMDGQDNLYITTNFNQTYAARDTSFSVPIFNSDTLSINFPGSNVPGGSHGDATKCGILKFNASLQPLRFEQLSSTPNEEERMSPIFDIRWSYTDESTNSLFLIVRTQLQYCFDSPAPPTEILYVLYRNDSCEMQNNLFWLRLDMDSWDLLSYGRVRSTVATYGGFYNTLIAKDNRVYAQFKFWNDFEFQDTAIYAPGGSTDYGLGMMMWDYDGNEIGYADYHSYHPENRPGQVHLVDSALYLTGQMFTGATFGDISARCLDYDMAYMAKYVDTSFMHPYVRPDLREQQTIAWEQELRFALADSTAALTAAASSGLPVAYYVEDSTVARAEGATLHLLREGSTLVTATQPGDERYRPAAPVTLPLTVTEGGQGEGIATPSDAPVAVYPNPAHNTLYVDAHGQPIASAMLVSAVGHRFPVSVVSNTIDLSPYPSGVYYLQIVTNKSISQIKIIKR